MFNKLAVIYALCGCIAAGHWFANEYDAGGSLASKNPVTSMFIVAMWPIYASFVFFDEEKQCLNSSKTQ